MKSIETTLANIKDISGKTTVGDARTVSLTAREKTVRAVKSGGLFFGLAVVSILVPMLHFVLVPVFLILSGIAFTKTMSESRVVTAISGACPNCGESVQQEGVFKVTGTKEVCPNCRQLLQISFGPFRQ